MIVSFRILITRDCSFDCTYCCNIFPEITKEIKSLTLHDIVCEINNMSSIKNIMITGGEPFLNRATFVSMSDLIHTIAWGRNVHFYIYTNGASTNIVQMLKELKDSTFGFSVRGINISYHSEYSESFPSRTKIAAINDVYPVTLRVEKSCLELPAPNPSPPSKYMMTNYPNMPGHTIFSSFSQMEQFGFIKDYRVFELNDCKRDNEIIYEIKQ